MTSHNKCISCRNDVRWNSSDASGDDATSDDGYAASDDAGYARDASTDSGYAPWYPTADVAARSTKDTNTN